MSDFLYDLKRREKEKDKVTKPVALQLFYNSKATER